jgi:2-hydroxychromene-2-carboxylate isomerase
MATPIEFWFSIASTYTYLSVCRMADIVGRTGIEIRCNPFNVRTIMLEQNNIPFRTKPVKLAYMWRDIERRAALYGLPFAGPAPYPLKDVSLADGVALLGAREGWCLEYTAAVYRRWFLGHQDMSNDEQIGAALKEVGQNPERIIALARGDGLQAELVSATERAKGLGVFGSPTFVVGDEVFWGDDRLDDAITWAQQGALHPN